MSDDIKIWKESEREAKRFLGPRPRTIPPWIYYKALGDLIKKTVDMKKLDS